MIPCKIVHTYKYTYIYIEITVDCQQIAYDESAKYYQSLLYFCEQLITCKDQIVMNDLNMRFHIHQRGRQVQIKPTLQQLIQANIVTTLHKITIQPFIVSSKNLTMLQFWYHPRFGHYVYSFNNHENNNDHCLQLCNYGIRS